MKHSVIENQSIADIATMYHGTLDAMSLILELNPSLTNASQLPAQGTEIEVGLPVGAVAQRLLVAGLQIATSTPDLAGVGYDIIESTLIVY